ncbi:MAG: ParA family protein [Filomicrobium sp.]
MLKIGVINSKGGVGKSSLVRALAVRAAKDFPPENEDDSARVAVADLDPQQTVAQWWARRSQNVGWQAGKVELLIGATTAQEVEDRLSYSPHAFEYVFLDTPPGHLMEVEDVVRLSDIVLIPIRPDYDTVLASRDALAIQQNSGTPALAILTQCPTNALAFGETAREALESVGVTVAKAGTTMRITWSKAFDTGKSPAELKGVAGTEIDDIWREVANHVRKA